MLSTSSNLLRRVLTIVCNVFIVYTHCISNTYVSDHAGDCTVDQLRDVFTSNLFRNKLGKI